MYLRYVIDLIRDNMQKLDAICEKHMVKSLFLFGSAATTQFNSETSDLDFMVEFQPSVNPIDYADNYFSLMDDLKIFERTIDLVSSRAVKNKILNASIDSTKVQLYAA